MQIQKEENINSLPELEEQDPQHWVQANQDLHSLQSVLATTPSWWMRIMYRPPQNSLVYSQQINFHCQRNVKDTQVSGKHYRSELKSSRGGQDAFWNNLRYLISTCKSDGMWLEFRKQLPDYIFKLHFILLKDSMFVGD